MSIEWMSVPLPCTINLAEAGDGLADSCDLSRDPDGLLTVRARASGLMSGRALAGTFLRGTDLRGRTTSGLDVAISGFIPRSWKSVDAPGGARMIVTGMADAASFTHAKEDPELVVEWLAGVPHDRIWPDTTTREASSSRRRQRIGRVGRWTRHETTTDRDHAFLSLRLPRLKSISVGVVRERSGVDRAGFLEFRSGRDGLPDEALRITARRALEFALGCGLKLLGWSEFSSRGLLIRSTLVSGCGVGAGTSAMPPAMLHDLYRREIDARVLSDFVKRFIRREPELDLNRVIWLYLNGREAPLDMAPAYFGAALETLRRAYFQHGSRVRRTKSLDKRHWRVVKDRLKREVESIRGEFDWPGSDEGLSQVANRIGNLNEVSGTKLNERFLDELGLATGAFERRGLQARHDAAHANAIPSDGYQNAIINMHALRTLLGRAVFAVLGMDVPYFDYTLPGWPPRALRGMQGVPETEPAPQRPSRATASRFPSAKSRG